MKHTAKSIQIAFVCDTPVLCSFCLLISSGTAWTERSRPSTTSKLARRGRFTCRCIQAGQHETTMHRTKRSQEKLGINVLLDLQPQKLPPVLPTALIKVIKIILFHPVPICSTLSSCPRWQLPVALGSLNTLSDWAEIKKCKQYFANIFAKNVWPDRLF